MFHVRRLVGQLSVLLLFGVMTASCERLQPLYEVENQPVPYLSAPLTLKQIETRIIKAGQKTKWNIRPIEPGRMLGIADWRKHSATVSIEYSQGFFSIRYKSSDNLLAEKAEEGQPHEGKFVIHRNFNNRVRKLARAIDAELSFP